MSDQGYGSREGAMKAELDKYERQHNEPYNDAQRSVNTRLGANDKNQTPEQERIITNACDGVDAAIAQLETLRGHCYRADERIFGGNVSPSKESAADEEDAISPNSAHGLNERINRLHYMVERVNEYAFQLLNRI